MLLKILRNAVGGLLVLADRLTRPTPIQRSPQQQAEIEQQTRQMKLYQLYACPFCIKTRRALRRLNLPIETRSVAEGSPDRAVLIEGGGRMQVPCLRISDGGEDMWMYESADIIHYLQTRFDDSDPTQQQVS